MRISAIVYHKLNGSEEHDTRPSTPSSLYEERYYLTSCEGYQCFELGLQEDAISPRLRAALGLVRPKEGERILDIGCGRGEAVLYCARHGAVAYGADYSADAVQIVQQGLTSTADAVTARIRILRADAKRLPFADGSFDAVLMLDLVEHLYPWELAEALAEARRLLVVGGRLIIHTAPNRWYYQFGYPLYRLFERLRGRQSPPDPRSRFPFHHLHVNEQDVLRLRRSLRSGGFESKVWLDNIGRPLVREPSPVLGPMVNLLVRILLQVYPFRWIFRNDIFAVARKRG